MRRAMVVLVAAMAMVLAGCVLSGKSKAMPATPAAPQPPASAPAEPLSIPQTQADELPPRVPLDLEALRTAQPVQSAPQTEQKPAPSQPPAKPRVAGSSAPTVPVGPKPVDAAPPPPETARPAVQEVLRPDEQRQLQEDAHSNRADAAALLARARQRRLSAAESRKASDINQFLKQSEQAEKNGDMRKAEQFARNAAILAKELQGGR